MLLQLQEEQQARTALSAANAALEGDLTSVRNELETLRNSSVQNGEAIGLADVKIEELNQRNAELETLLAIAKTDLADTSLQTAKQRKRPKRGFWNSLR